MSTAALVTLVAFTVGLVRGALINNAGQPLVERVLLANASVEGIRIAEIWLSACGAGGGSFLVSKPRLRHKMMDGS